LIYGNIALLVLIKIFKLLITMPELPEVETIKNDLSKMIVGQTVKKVNIFLEKSIRNKPSEFIGALEDKKILRLDRMAKIIIMDLDSGQKILFHLKMTGQLVYCSKNNILAGGHSGKQKIQCAAGRHTRLEIVFSDSSKLFFNDLRIFGYVKLSSAVEISKIKQGFGPEPLEENFNFDYLSEKLARSQAPVKAILLNQKIIAGIGNIYADEILFASNVLPHRKAKTLNSVEVKKIVDNSIIILNKAIKHRGTTFNNYIDASGKQGGYLKLLKIYGRQGKDCLKCGGIVKKTKTAGRGTHYCEKCQK
jgi:formamidopyrimidine-DNA glycosylase